MNDYISRTVSSEASFPITLESGAACRVLTLLAALLLGGCAYMQPYVPLKPQITASNSTVMPRLDDAISKIDKWSEDTESLRNSVSQTQRALNLATFGFGFGAGAASIYGAHRDAVTGLGLIAGGTYTAGALFVPADQTSLYNAALKSLVCIRNKADGFRATVGSAKLRQSNDLNAGYVKNQLSPAGCQPQGTLKTAVENAERAREKAAKVLSGAVNSDLSAANLAETAGLNVVTALNEELAKRAASAEAVLASARSAVGMATFIGSTPFPGSGSDGKKAALIQVQACTGPAEAEITALEGSYKALESSINSAINSLASLDTACVFNAPAVATFIVSQDNITLATDSSYVITIAGGRPVYRAGWTGPTPAGISHQLIGASLVLTASANAKSGTEGTLEISDSSMVPAIRPIKIKIK